MAQGFIYEDIALALWSAGIDYVADDIRCAFVDSSYSLDASVDQFWADVSAAEVSGTGYTAGGELLTGKSLVDTDTGVVNLACDNPSWGTATITGIRYAVFYKDTGSAATSPLMVCVDYEADYDVTASTLEVAIPADGLLGTWNS